MTQCEIIPGPLTPVETLRVETEAKIKKLTEALDFIEGHQAFFNKPMGYGNWQIISGQIYIWGLSHEEAVRVMLEFPGNWQKRYTGNSLTYCNDISPFFSIELNGVGLPPSCKLITEQVLVPEHLETRTRIDCGVEEKA